MHIYFINLYALFLKLNINKVNFGIFSLFPKTRTMTQHIFLNYAHHWNWISIKSILNVFPFFLKIKIMLTINSFELSKNIVISLYTELIRSNWCLFRSKFHKESHYATFRTKKHLYEKVKKQTFKANFPEFSILHEIKKMNSWFSAKFHQEHESIIQLY